MSRVLCCAARGHPWRCPQTLGGVQVGAGGWPGAGGRCKAPVPRECSESLFLLLLFLLLLFLFFFLLTALLLLLLLFLLFFLAGARWLV